MEKTDWIFVVHNGDTDWFCMYRFEKKTGDEAVALANGILDEIIAEEGEAPSVKDQEPGGWYLGSRHYGYMQYHDFHYAYELRTIDEVEVR